MFRSFKSLVYKNKYRLFFTTVFCHCSKRDRYLVYIFDEGSVFVLHKTLGITSNEQ